MSNLTDAIVKNANNSLPTNEATAAMVSSDQGNSGSAGTGIDLTGSSTFDCASELGFYPRQIYIEVAGNFCFTTLDGNTHVLPVDAKTWITAIWIKEIYDASHATYPTTSTGIHCFA